MTDGSATRLSIDSGRKDQPFREGFHRWLGWPLRDVLLRQLKVALCFRGDGAVARLFAGPGCTQDSWIQVVFSSQYWSWA